MPARLSRLRTWMLSKPYRLFVSALVLAAIFYLLWRVIATGQSENIQITTAPVERGSIENLVTATGILQPRDFVDVGAQVSGQLKLLHVDVGSEVKKGDLLAEIDATVYAANVDGTRAQLASQQAQLRDREAQVKLAEITYQRQKNLQKADASTQEALESAEASLTSARAQLDMLKAQIKQTQSSLRVQEANLDYANIYAPMDGTVVTVTSRQGQTLNTNQTAPTLMRIADLSTMTVQTQVSEADIGKLRIGMPVYFTTLGSQGRRWYSKLDRLQPTPEVLNNVVLYNALFDVPNDQRLLMTQMSTQVFFISAQAKDVLLVPMSALTFTRPAARSEENLAKPLTTSDAQADSGNAQQSNTRERRPSGERGERSPESSLQRQASVEVITKTGRQESRSVSVGVTNRIQAEIIDGLAEGETVVTGARKVGEPAATSGGQRGFNPRMLR